MADQVNQGALSQLCMDSALPFDTSSIPFEFASSTLKSIEEFAHTDGVRGDIQQYVTRQKLVRHTAGGQVSMNFTATELDWLIPYILGGTTAGGVTEIDSDIPLFYICEDKIDDVYTFSNCAIVSTTLSGTSGQPLTLTLSIEAEKEDTTSTAAFPSLTYDTGDLFVMSDCVLTIDGTARVFNSFTLTIDRVADAARWNNSLYRTKFPSHNTIVGLDVSMPAGGNTDLLGGGVTGFDGTFAFGDGSNTYTVSTGKIVIPPVTPELPGKSEIMLPLSMGLFASGATKQITITKT